MGRSDSAEVLRVNTTGKAKGVTGTGQVALLLGTLAQSQCRFFACFLVGEPGVSGGVVCAPHLRIFGGAARSGKAELGLPLAREVAGTVCLSLK